MCHEGCFLSLLHHFSPLQYENTGYILRGILKLGVRFWWVWCASYSICIMGTAPLVDAGIQSLLNLNFAITMAVLHLHNSCYIGRPWGMHQGRDCYTVHFICHCLACWWMLYCISLSFTPCINPLISLILLPLSFSASLLF